MRTGIRRPDAQPPSPSLPTAAGHGGPAQRSEAVDLDAARLRHLLQGGEEEAGRADLPPEAGGEPEPQGLTEQPVWARRERDGSGKGDGGKGDEEVPQPPPPPAGPVRAEALLAFLDPGKAEAPERPRPADLTELAGALAERVLVGRSAEGMDELRITLKGDTFGGTEVVITRRPDGLEVRLDPGTGAAQDLLRDRGADLARSLSSRLDAPVTVALSGGGGGDRQDRSQGYQDILRYVAERP